MIASSSLPVHGVARQTIEAIEYSAAPDHISVEYFRSGTVSRKRAAESGKGNQMTEPGEGWVAEESAIDRGMSSRNTGDTSAMPARDLGTYDLSETGGALSPMHPPSRQAATCAALTDPWLRHRLASLHRARFHEPLPQRLQESLRNLRLALETKES